MTAVVRADHMTVAQAREIALRIMAENGLIDGWGVDGWALKFDAAKRRAGQCQYGPKIISLSRYLLAQRPYADSLNTITHEIAHALVGGRHGHDEVWARQHRALGGDGKRCFEHFDEKAPWVGTCEKGKTYARYRAPKRLTGWACKCQLPKHPLVWART